MIEPNPTVVIRCDGSAAIGLGHVMRCLSLAHALRDIGIDARFVMRSAPQDVVDRVAEDGFSVELLELPECRLLPTDDARLTTGYARRCGATMVLVDHYGADEAYLHEVADSASLAVIDDRGDRDLSRASWLLNQNLGAVGVAYEAIPGATVLLGPAYALLRPGFAEARARARRRFDVADRGLLVTLGGGDTSLYASQVVRALDEIDRRLEVVVVQGVRGEHDDVLAHRSTESHHDVRVAYSPPDMARLMAEADVSINAGGSTCWELLCLGVPMIVTELSPDQSLNQRALENAGVAIHVPASRLAVAGQMIDGLLSCPQRRREMSALGEDLVDGEGAARAASSLAHVARSNRLGHARA